MDDVEEVERSVGVEAARNDPPFRERKDQRAEQPPVRRFASGGCATFEEMSKEHGNEAPKESVPARPLDLGLSEGKSMAFAPTSALPPADSPIGGLGPSAPQDAAPADPPPPPPPPPPAEGNES